jgi:hypothetical protein
VADRGLDTESWTLVNQQEARDGVGELGIGHRPDEKALAFARRLAAGPTCAYNVTKQLLLVYREQGVAAADSLTAHGLCTAVRDR